MELNRVQSPVDQVDRRTTHSRINLTIAIIMQMHQCWWIYEPPKIKQLGCCSQSRIISNRWRRKNSRTFCQIMTSPTRACNNLSISTPKVIKTKTEKSLGDRQIVWVDRWESMITQYWGALQAWWQALVVKTNTWPLWRDQKLTKV